MTSIIMGRDNNQTNFDEIKSMLSDLDKKIIEFHSEQRFRENFTIKNANSELGDIREQIHKYGYGSFLESAKNTSFWKKISKTREDLFKSQNDMEICHVYMALSKLNESEISEFSKILGN